MIHALSTGVSAQGGDPGPPLPAEGLGPTLVGTNGEGLCPRPSLTCRPRERVPALAEPVIGPRFARTRWLGRDDSAIIPCQTATLDWSRTWVGRRVGPSLSFRPSRTGPRSLCHGEASRVPREGRVKNYFTWSDFSNDKAAATRSPREHVAVPRPAAAPRLMALALLCRDGFPDLGKGHRGADLLRAGRPALEKARDFRNRGSAESHDLAARELPDLRGQNVDIGKRLCRRFPGSPLRRSCQVVVVVSHLAHQLLGHTFTHLVGETAQLFCTRAPMRRIIVGHGHNAPCFPKAGRSWRKLTIFGRRGCVNMLWRFFLFFKEIKSQGRPTEAALVNALAHRA